MPVWIIPIRDGWLAYARPMCALSLRDDTDGRDNLDGYRNRSRYYQGIVHEVPIPAVATTVMYVQGQTETRAHRRGMSVLSPGVDMSITGGFARILLQKSAVIDECRSAIR